MIKSNAIAGEIAPEFLGNPVHAGPRSPVGQVAAGQIGPEVVIGDGARGGERRAGLLSIRYFRGK